VSGAAGTVLLAAALEYANVGLLVFPLDGKIPRVSGGFKSASCDPARIGEWWRQWPRANVGIRTGVESGLLVLDVDPQHGGAATLKALEAKHGPLPETARALTGGGGWHDYFLHPGVEVRNSIAKLGPGLDVRGDGGYIVAPPSLHASGRTYRWLRPLGDGLADPPAWLLEQAQTRRNGQASAVAGVIPEGLRNDELFKLGRAVRRRGAGEPEILALLRETNRCRCDPMLPDEEVEKVARSSVRYEPAGSAGEPREPVGLVVVPLEEFAAVDEPGAEALVGNADEALIPEDGDVMFYGDGGAGKTTLAIDLACHLAAGDDWLGVRVGRPGRVLLVENEGPRALFRRKLRRKQAGWQGSPLEGRVLVHETPWGRLSFVDETCREALADTIREREIDVVIVGPVTRSGMDEAGTLQEVRDFMLLVADVRERAGRPVTFVLIHHENKGGKVSGAWEPAGDTLLHVSAQGHGRTRLYMQKVRWSSLYHGTTLHLVWTDGDGFAVEEKPELDDETLAAQILDAVGRNGGTTWGKVEEATPGVNRQRRMDVRDGLLASGQLVNVGRGEDGADVALRSLVEGKPARLYLADDPAIKHLLPALGAVGEQPAPATGATGLPRLLPAPAPIGSGGVGAAAAPPANTSGNAPPGEGGS